jgi:hypothetical protein
MTEFELILTDVLREEAEEIAMSTDQQRAAEDLRTRLDQSERHRRGWYVAAAVAVAVAVVAAVLALRPSGDTDSVPPVTDPTPTTVPYTTTNLDPQITLRLPSWTDHATREDGATATATFAESDCAGLNGENPCPEDADLRLRLLTLKSFYRPGEAAITTDPSYDDYLAHLDALEPLGIAAISERADSTVDGRPATAMSLSTLVDAQGAVACPLTIDKAADCMHLIAGRDSRIVVVDQGAGNAPTVFYLSLNTGAPDRDERFAELDTMAESASFG